MIKNKYEKKFGKMTTKQRLNLIDVKYKKINKYLTYRARSTYFKF